MHIEEDCSGFLQDSKTEDFGQKDSGHSFYVEKEIDSTGYYRLIKACRDGRWFFLKSLRDPFDKQEFFINMLQKEYSILSSIGYPGVVQCACMENIAPYGQCIVMEYIDGETLEEFIIGQSNAPANVQRRLFPRIALELAETIAHIHSYQIVHRDIKPCNIMISSNGQNVKLIDFGLSDTDDYMILKQPAGTLKYMDPELKDKSGADVRADIYSYGLVIRQLFSSAKNFRHKKGILAIAQKCLAPVEERYQSMKDVVADIKALIEQEPFYRQKSGILAIVSTLVLLMLIPFVLYLYNQKHPEYIQGTDVPVSYIEDLTADYSQGQKMDLEKAIADFEKNRTGLNDRIEAQLSEREAFLTTFTPDSIYKMRFADFQITNQEGFCFKLRNRMPLLGDLKPYPLYTFYSAHDEDSLFLKMRDNIVQLLMYGSMNKFDDLYKALPRTPLRFRILSLYYPEFYLPILSDDHAKQIMDALLPNQQPDSSNYTNNTDSYRQLLQLHEENPYFHSLSLIEYAEFLLNYYPAIKYEN